MNPALNLLAQGSWDVFVPYGRLHALTLVVCALLIAAPTFLGRALAKDAEALLRQTLAAIAVCYWLAYNAWWNRHGLDPRTGLPLHICDLNGLIAPFALWTGQRWTRATLYFWTAALTLQAFIQPSLTAGPALPVFWAFGVAHTIITASAVYDVAVLGFRPTWRDLGYALAASAIYLVAIVPIDLWLGANYGFVGNPAEAREIPPFVAALGPWPRRVIVLAALTACGFVVILLPWVLTAPRPRLQPTGTKP